MKKFVLTLLVLIILLVACSQKDDSKDKLDIIDNTKNFYQVNSKILNIEVIENLTIGTCMQNYCRSFELTEQSFVELLRNAEKVNNDNPLLKKWPYEQTYSGYFTSKNKNYDFALFSGGLGRIIPSDKNTDCLTSDGYKVNINEDCIFFTYNERYNNEDYLSVSVSFYSGRENPAFTLRNDEEINIIKEKIKKLPKIDESNDFGKYMGNIIVFNRGIKEFTNMVIIGSDTVAVGFGKERQYFKDTNHELNKYMIELIKKYLKQEELPKYFYKSEVN